MKLLLPLLLLFANFGFAQGLVEIPLNKHDAFSCELNIRDTTSLVIFIAGSGPTDKNGNSPQLVSNYLKELSDSLNSKGISTLRFDKRGAGESKFPDLKEEKLTIDTLVSDVLFIKNYITEKYNFKKIYLLGHSEGSLLGILAMNRDTSIDGLISISGAALSADSIIMLQMQNQDEQIQTTVRGYLDELKKGKLITNVDYGYYALFRPSVQPYMISWIHYNPVFEIQKITKPILIVHGTADIQVDTSNAVGLYNNSQSAELNIIKSMNHILKQVDTMDDNLKSYNDLSYHISNELIISIVNFLNSRDN